MPEPPEHRRHDDVRRVVDVPELRYESLYLHPGPAEFLRMGIEATPGYNQALRYQGQNLADEPAYLHHAVEHPPESAILQRDSCLGDGALKPFWKQTSSFSPARSAAEFMASASFVERVMGFSQMT